MTKLDFISYLRQGGYGNMNYGGTFDVLASVNGGVVVLADEEAIHIRKKDGSTQIMVYEYVKYEVKTNDLGCMELFKREEEKKDKKKGSGLGALAALAGAMGGMGGGMPPIPPDSVIGDEVADNDAVVEESEPTEEVDATEETDTTADGFYKDDDKSTDSLEEK